ncbi:MAG: hypothetical protein PHH71_03680 [Clostridia bacterium]|nr:hypothetical protein [Clostridia bacterium]MDD3231963.1 hypothetical protein [Clostridia bacterium]MDD3862796.1 hypothetical protein [Clostridia bacterium]MDD4408788.1 hypothetical protein [Clostridia bacterium]
MKKNLKVAEFTGFKQALLIVFLVFSFILTKAFNPIALHFINGIFPSLLTIIFYGILYWLIFEVIAGFFYSALRLNLEKSMSYNQFMNVLRTIILFSNLIIFFATVFFIYINFYTAYFILFFNIIISFLVLCVFYKIIKDKFLTQNLQDLKRDNKDNEKNQNQKNDFQKLFFNLVFVYLFLLVFLWGLF